MPDLVQRPKRFGSFLEAYALLGARNHHNWKFGCPDGEDLLREEAQRPQSEREPRAQLCQHPS